MAVCGFTVIFRTLGLSGALDKTGPKWQLVLGRWPSPKLDVPMEREGEGERGEEK